MYNNARIINQYAIQLLLCKSKTGKKSLPIKIAPIVINYVAINFTSSRFHASDVEWLASDSSIIANK